MNRKILIVLLESAALLILALVLIWVLSVKEQTAIQVTNLAVSRVTEDSAVIVVKTNIPTSVSVQYGPDAGNYPAGTGSISDQYRHEVKLEGLAGMNTVYYQVTIEDSTYPQNTLVLNSESNDGMNLRFRPARATGQPIQYGVLGDTQSNAIGCVEPPPPVVDTIIGQMVAEDLDLALLVGDSIYSHDSTLWPEYPSDSLEMVKSRYDALFGTTMPLTSQTPLYLAVGNHEEIGIPPAKTAFEEEFSNPEKRIGDEYAEEYYSFDNGDTHFIVLCTECPEMETKGQVIGEQLDWLQADLNHTKMPWIVVAMHRPVWDVDSRDNYLADGITSNEAGNTAGDRNGLENWSELHNIFSEKGVDLVFQGHDHVYNRQKHDGVTYVITGSTGNNTIPFFGRSEVPCSDDMPGCKNPEHVMVKETSTELTLTATKVGMHDGRDDNELDYVDYTRCDFGQLPSYYYETYEIPDSDPSNPDNPESLIDEISIKKDPQDQTIRIDNMGGDPGSGGCSIIGIWDGNRTCTLTDNVYVENMHGIILEDGVTLDGNGYRLIGNHTNENNNIGVLVNTSDATIENLGVEGFQVGIQVTEYSGNTISNNTVRYNDYGIWLDKSSSTQVQGNTITDNNSESIRNWGASDNTITDNVISASSDLYHTDGISYPHGNSDFPATEMQSDIIVSWTMVRSRILDRL